MPIPISGTDQRRLNFTYGRSSAGHQSAVAEGHPLSTPDPNSGRLAKVLKYSVVALLGLMTVYGLATASATALLIVGGTCLGLATFATCVCVYVLNNTRF